MKTARERANDLLKFLPHMNSTIEDAVIEHIELAINEAVKEAVESGLSEKGEK